MMQMRLHVRPEQLGCLQGRICLALSRRALEVSARHKQDGIGVEMA